MLCAQIVKLSDICSSTARMACNHLAKYAVVVIAEGSGMTAATGHFTPFPSIERFLLEYG
ncbi:hypothetical protein ROA7745_03583 [Roseovarius aestuarii]|uniref:Uncharacterized protein n=1 Tax=Roseovarius aestuarii TaxID=475083 RepID=A0A1X7BVV4_9RHOB|nr:hypothetical protein ROA7745_03583 [Roseovarius aestuarii]